MGDRAIENRIRKLMELDEKKKELEKEAAELKTEIKEAMEGMGVEEIKTKNFIVRWKEIISNSFDSTKFKAEFPDLYKRFSKQSTSKRFTFS